MITLTQDWQVLLFGVWLLGFFWFLYWGFRMLWLAAHDRTDMKWVYFYLLGAPVWFLFLIFWEIEILALKFRLRLERKRLHKDVIAYYEDERRRQYERRHNQRH